MSRLSEERKQELRKKYANKSSKAGTKAGGPSMGRRPGPGGPPGMRGPGGKPKNARHVIHRLFNYLGKDKVKLIYVFICVVTTTITTLSASYLLRPIINNLVDDNLTPEVRIQNLIRGLLLMAAIYLVGIMGSYLQQRIMIGVSQNALVKIREELFSKMQKLPLKYHDSHNHGDLMSRYTNDLDSVGEMLNNTLSQIFSGAIALVGTVILMFVTNWILAIVTIIMVPLMILAAGKLGNVSRRYYGGQQKALGAVNGYVEESISGQKVVKVFCHEEMMMDEFEFLSDELRENQVKAQFFGGIMGPVMGSLSQFSYTITAAVGGILCLTANFDIGGLSIFTTYSKQFARPINELSQQMNTIFSALAGAERVFAVMDEEPELEDGVIILEPTKMEGEVVIKDLTFGYKPDKTILKNINVVAKPGQKVAFVGSTGAGKTTITNLINRFYEINEGQILIDGIDIKDIKRDSLRSNIAMVLQDTHLFSGTVMENIRYGRLDASDEEVVAAAKTASAHSFIERLSNGYQTVLEGDGSNLSQGQRQLLNIARASISKAPILILDEATSSVDTRTEKHIERGMDRLMKNRTTFVIAHRLSTVRNSDQIIVLEQGEIVEQGTHDELLAMEGRYYQLYTGAVELD